MTPDQLSAIHARLDAATPGLESLVGVELKYALRVTYPQSVACRELIANAPIDLCALLDEVERLRAENARLSLAVPRIIQFNDADADRAFDAIQPSLGTPVPPERRIRRQADVDAAFARGAEAMREAAAQRCEVSPIHGEKTTTARRYADAVRALPVPEDK